MNTAPVVIEEGTSWKFNVTLIPSNTDSAFVYKGPQSLQELSQDDSIAGAMVTTYAPVSLLIDDICFDYATDVLGNANLISFLQYL